MAFSVEYWVDIQKFPWPLYPRYKHNDRRGTRIRIPGVVGDTKFDVTEFFKEPLPKSLSSTIIDLPKKPSGVSSVATEAGYIVIPEGWDGVIEILMNTSPVSGCAVPPDMSIMSPSGTKYGPGGDYLVSAAGTITNLDGKITYNGSSTSPEKFTLEHPAFGTWYMYGHSNCTNHDRDTKFTVYPNDFIIYNDQWSEENFPQNIFELLWVVVSMDIYKGDDTWSLWWNDEIVFTNIHSKHVMEKKHLRPLKRFQPGVDILTFIWHNISGTPKILWVDFECACRNPRINPNWVPPKRKPRPPENPEPIFPKQPEPPIPDPPDPPKPPEPPIYIPPEEPPEDPPPYGHDFDYMIYIYWGPNSYSIIDTNWLIKTGEKQGKVVVLWNEPYFRIPTFSFSYGTDANNGVFIDSDNTPNNDKSGEGYYHREVASIVGHIEDNIYFGLNDYLDTSKASKPVLVQLLDSNYNVLHEYNPLNANDIPFVGGDQTSFGTVLSESGAFPIVFLYEFTWSGTGYQWKAVH